MLRGETRISSEILFLISDLEVQNGLINEQVLLNVRGDIRVAANPRGRIGLRAAAGGLRGRPAPGRAAKLEDAQAGSRELGHAGWNWEAVSAPLLLRPSQDGAAKTGGVDL